MPHRTLAVEPFCTPKQCSLLQRATGPPMPERPLRPATGSKPMCVKSGPPVYAKSPQPKSSSLPIRRLEHADSPDSVHQDARDAEAAEAKPYAVGQRVFRKGEACTVVKVDQLVDPPSYVVRKADGSEVGSEHHLLQADDPAKVQRKPAKSSADEHRRQEPAKALKFPPPPAYDAKVPSKSSNSTAPIPPIEEPLPPASTKVQSKQVEEKDASTKAQSQKIVDALDSAIPQDNDESAKPIQTGTGSSTLPGDDGASQQKRAEPTLEDPLGFEETLRKEDAADKDATRTTEDRKHGKAEVPEQPRSKGEDDTKASDEAQQ